MHPGTLEFQQFSLIHCHNRNYISVTRNKGPAWIKISKFVSKNVTLQMTVASICSCLWYPMCFSDNEINPLNAELNPICHLLALLGAHHILHVGRIRVKQNSRTPERRKSSCYSTRVIVWCSFCFTLPRARRIRGPKCSYQTVNSVIRAWNILNSFV